MNIKMNKYQINLSGYYWKIVGGKTIDGKKITGCEYIGNRYAGFLTIYFESGGKMFVLPDPNKRTGKPTKKQLLGLLKWQKTKIESKHEKLSNK